VVVVVLLLLLLCGQVPALQLRESKLSPQRLRHAFLHVVVAMRGLYQRAKLVHGDLSEFNILYVGGKERPVVFIDVGKHSSPRV
jgi:RIO kinase 1